MFLFTLTNILTVFGFGLVVGIFLTIAGCVWAAKHWED